jgi:hypothetical protein
MELTITDGEVYVPLVGGNDATDKPIKFNLKYLTVEDQTEIEYFEFIQSKNGTNKINAKFNHREIFKRGVVSIDNLRINDKDIKTPDDFLAIRGSRMLTLMLEDVSLHLHKAGDVDLKN